MSGCLLVRKYILRSQCFYFCQPELSGAGGGAHEQHPKLGTAPEKTPLLDPPVHVEECGDMVSYKSGLRMTTTQKGINVLHLTSHFCTHLVWYSLPVPAKGFKLVKVPHGPSIATT